MAGALALLLVVARSNKTDIFAAVRKDSPELIQRAIDEGEDVNAVGVGIEEELGGQVEVAWPDWLSECIEQLIDSLGGEKIRWNASADKLANDSVNLVGEADLERVEARLKSINTFAPIERCVHVCAHHTCPPDRAVAPP